MRLYSKVPKVETKVEFVRHPTATSVVLGYFRHEHPRMTDERLMAATSDFHLFMGRKWVKPARVKELISWVRQVGVWGYCNHVERRHKEIHFWIGKRACRENVLEFILHEVAHAGGFSGEQVVCRLAGLGAFAYHVFEKDFDGRLPSQKDGRCKRRTRIAAWDTAFGGRKP
jgi:hypothetical protein